MKHRLVIVTEIISPYRIPLFNALALSAAVDPHVLFLAETDPSLRQWKVYKEEIKFSFQVLPSWRWQLGKHNALMNRDLGKALEAAKPDVILCGGYNYIASWQALRWARAKRVPFLLWSESNQQDRRRGFAPIEFLKRFFLEKCSGFVVPGRSAREYLRAQNIGQEIFTAPNAVDNNLFGNAAGLARQSGELRRRQLRLPDRYFLFVGRLVRDKGIFDLLAAYAKLDEPLRRTFGLVFAGDGAARRQLEEHAASISPGAILCPGFVHRDQLAEYYAFAQVLVLPTYSDTWGLVVNEAMACGLPVIVSRAAGCAADLLQEECNGLLVKPGDVSGLCAAMTNLASQHDLAATMGAASREIVSHYSPLEWAKGVAVAVETNCARNRGSGGNPGFRDKDKRA